MVPDFSQLRKQQRDRKACQGHRASARSSKPSTNKGFANSQSSQQFNKQSAFAFSAEIEQAFFELWTTCPSWSPILKKPDGWITIVKPSGKKVPLVLGSIESNYRRDYIIGKRFGKLTNYLMIDVDKNSPFHPSNKGIGPILEAMESLGLCRYILIRSSDSEGLHIYFPLAEPVSAWAIAYAAHAALTATGVKVAGGICELFPNKKAFHAEHNGHRLPLQQDSFILDKDFRCTSNDKGAFLQQWQHCAVGQDKALLTELLADKPLSVPMPVSVGSLPPIEWTGPGQSNEVMKKLVNYGDRYLGLKTIPALGNWIVTVAPQLPGFYLFASEESKNDLTRKNWAYRWAKSHFKSVRQYAAKKSTNHNAVIAAEALERLMIALSRIIISGKIGIAKLWKTLSDISKELFGIGFSWGLFQKHRKLIMEKVGNSCKLGLSRGSEEDKDSSISEPAASLESEITEEPKGPLTELLTARCVTSIEGEALSPSRTPSEHENSAASDREALATDTSTAFQPAGNVEERTQPQEAGKAKASGVRPKGVIQATAAQLLQVLGKACPFIGPGLWEVKRSEVPAKAWGQLCRLVGEA